MSYLNIVLKNRKLMILYFITCFMLCFVDTKTFGMIYIQEDMVFRLLTHQVFLIFLVPIFVLNVINEKFICIQKDYMVIYSINEKKNIRKIFYIILATELIFYILGQIFFQGINYFITGEVYLISIKFNVLTILEILSASYIVLSILLLLKKDLFTYINYYILLMVLLVVNSGYITFPMTIKVLSLLQHDYIKLLLSRTFLFLLTFFIFKMSLKRYSSKFYGG